ncbi:hypothetical protein [Alteromonas sp. ASW11-130]|uniref:hypothetical protein n=1 Tax=Alteromonas sp. ASW11-130 TaxID=3015775 RepID=UPI002242B538|nr:hypothetical protein [Alteromonas sp. ASW11-130]MCW8091155.1 hypothetical protein [Alteromonas sp. ASW11-130]
MKNSVRKLTTLVLFALSSTISLNISATESGTTAEKKPKDGPIVVTGHICREFPLCTATY